MNDYARFAEADRQFINRDTIGSYCNTNESLIGKDTKVTGLVLEFPGLGGNSCLGGNMDELTVYDNGFTRQCAAKGLVAAYLFPGPWSWMNRGAVRIIDLVVDALADKYGLVPGKFSLVVMGGSMGGHGALLYAIDSRHRVSACVAHCPCRNPLESFSVNAAFPRTFLCAANEYDMPLEDALKQLAPGLRTAEMPRIPYLVTGDEFDECFPAEDTRELAEKMKKAGLDVTYLFLRGQQHGGLEQADREKIDAFVFRNSGAAE